MTIEFTCPFCGQTTSVDPQRAYTAGPCRTCGQTVTPPNPEGIDGCKPLPVCRSSWATIAGYAGMLPLVAVFAPIAVITGIMAVIDIRRHPHKDGMGRALVGLGMGLLFTGLWIVFFLRTAVESLR